MRKSFVLSLALVFVMAVSALGFSGHEMWKLQLDSPITSGITVSGGTVFFGTETGKIFAVNAKSGQVAWEYKADNTIYGVPAVTGDTVIFAQGSGELLAFKATAGGLVWTSGGEGGKDLHGRDVNDGLSDGASTGGGLVYVSKADRKVHAFSTKDGKAAWTYATSDQGVRAAPLYHDGIVFIGEYDGTFSMVDAKTGKRLNGGGAGGAVNTPTVNGGNVYFSAWDGSVNCVKINGVEPLWHVNVHDTITTQPEISAGKIVVGTGSGAVIALDEKTGRTLWRFNTNSGSILAKPVIGDGVVIAGAETGSVCVLNLNTGRQAGTLTDATGLSATPAFSDGVFYFGSGKTLYAFQ